MISYKTAIVVSAAITLASAWSTQFPQFYQAFATPHGPLPPLPSPFSSFFPEPSSHQLQSRFYQPIASQFYRPPLQFYQPPPPPPPPVSATKLRPTALALPTSSTVPIITPAAVTSDVHHHHHHHVFYYYYYLPADGGEMPSADARARGGGGSDGPRQSAWRSCGGVNRPEVTSPAACPPTPAYLPPASPTPLPPPPTPTAPPPPPSPPTTTTSRPPCDDDTVVVDNVDYYPFGRAPIVVTAATVSGNVHVDAQVPRNHRPETKSNFILANYLLPPDK